ncbi:MAG: trypsin-like peptidase domain-containing protein [Candidatus Omnitrophica bacterium]|nr:trypsin-like peptidase domain-containing protein [Candidatus Omnitrophota bacterium]
MRKILNDLIHRLGTDQYFALYALILLLSSVLVFVVIVTDYNMGYRQFKIEMSEHWVDPSVEMTPGPARGRGRGGSQAAILERTYNKVAHGLDDISVTITGMRTTNGGEEQVHGSGILIADQLVLTNYHVAYGALDLRVTVSSKNPVVYPASICLTDKTNDLALLKVETTDILPSADIGNSDTVEVGDLVFAMGNAFGKGNIFTTGVVCDRMQSFTVGTRVYTDMIRTETYTYPGSSGGPLANMNGEVIGVNTAIYDPEGKFTGISFALPINRAQALLDKVTGGGAAGQFSLVA